MKLGILGALLATMFLIQDQTGMRSVADEHLKSVMPDLPSDGVMRSYIERGRRGNGKRYSWMDHMKELDVKRAKIFLDFSWSGHPVDIYVTRIAFFKSYDVNCAQIIDAGQLESIDKTGLKKELKEFAIAQTAKSDWSYFENRPQARHGSAIVDVVDDEWLPLFGPNLTPSDENSERHEIPIDGDGTYLLDTLRSLHFSQERLDGALMLASVSLDDRCSINLLVNAGANPNFRNRDGETPLMLATFAGLINNVQALLQAGADAQAKNLLGQTALDIAKQRKHDNLATLLKK